MSDDMDILNTVAHMDIFDLCDCLEDDSIDMILCDLPYGITACEWDNVIPFEPMWECFKRIIKPRGAVVLTASQPFTSKLVMSNLEWFKYEWVVNKSSGSDFLNAKRKPMKSHENILVFASGQTNYNPQMAKGKAYQITSNQKAQQSFSGGRIKVHYKSSNNGIRYPTTSLKFNWVHGKHPTQKPVALFEYLIRTYTQPGETVFDPCVGSGTTALAARNTGRNYIVGDSSAEYVEVARKRLAAPYTMPMFEERKPDDMPVQAAMELE